MTASAALGPVQAAIYAALVADADLMDQITGVYDEVPEGAALPYVVIGDTIETSDNAHGEHGRSTLVTLHVWSEYRGAAEAAAITSRVVRVLDHAPLTVAGARHIVTRFEYGQTLKDPEPMLRHAVSRFRVLTALDA